MLFANMRINPSIILLKKHMEGASSSFVFETATKEKIEKLVSNLNIRKAVQSNDVPTKLDKDGRTEKSNYGPISVLSNVSKIYRKFIKYFLKINPVFVKAQHILLVMIEKMKTSRGNKQFCTAILTDLSRAFDCICYDLLIGKLNAYGFDKKALKLIYDYLNGRSQKIKAVLHSVVN